ncbi:MAG: hypothetical protein VYB54_03445 [Pseudomonadota bacterium]|nr:hypothetical protein [Pseudomonadota bacterium]
MNRDLPLVLAIGACIANGIFSPHILAVVGFAPLWYPAFLPLHPSLLFYGASILLSTFTLVTSGVVAALFERITGRRESDTLSMFVWLLAALALGHEGLLRATGFLL